MKQDPKTVHEWGGLSSQSNLFLVMPDKMDIKRYLYVFYVYQESLDNCKVQRDSKLWRTKPAEIADVVTVFWHKLVKSFNQ